MKKIGLTLLTVVLLTLLASVPGIHSSAQGVQPLKVGELALGELTKAAPEVKFSFSGKKGEYYIATFDGTGKGILGADLTVLDGSGATLGKTTSISNAVWVQLPADGDYTLNVKRKASDEGPFAVQLYHLSKLEKGSPVDAQITLRLVTDGGRLVSTNTYYLIDSAADFKLTVTLGERTGPQNAAGTVEYNVSRARKGEPSRLDALYQASGDKFAAVSVTFKGSPELHFLTLKFSGYFATGKVTKDDILTQKFSLKVEESS
jgi:hypothetical protein